MDDLIRTVIHDALDVEPPRGLRSRVIASVPMEPARAPRRFDWPVEWVGGFVAGLLAATLIAVLMLSNLAPHNTPGSALPPTPSLISPEGIAVAPDGRVYVSDYVGDRVFRINRNGTLTVFAGGGVYGNGPATKAWLNHPAAIAFDSHGNLYIADSVGGTIRRVDAHGTISTFALATAALGLAIGSDGLVYEAGYSGELNVFTPNVEGSNLHSEGIDVAAITPPLPQFSYMTFDSAGNLYVADRAPATSGNIFYPTSNGGCRIVRAAPKRAMQSAVWDISIAAGTGKCGYSGDGGPATSAQLDNPAGIAFDAAGNLYIADTDNHRIRRVAADGTISTVAGTGVEGYSGDGGPATAAELAFPAGIAVAPGNLLYISDASCTCLDPTSNGHVRMIDLSTGVITTVVHG